ncbi:hypothetical protein MTO96_037699 [Rhipicephalus appendiculatus]
MDRILRQCSGRPQNFEASFFAKFLHMKRNANLIFPGLDSLSDKEGGFVLVPQTVYEEKVAAALSGNLRELQKVAPTKVKRKAERLCEVAGLTRLALSLARVTDEVGEVYSFFMPDDSRHAEELVATLRQAGQAVRCELSKLAKQTRASVRPSPKAK